MSASYVVDNLVCSAILNDEGNKNNTYHMANHFMDAIQHDLQACVVPAHYTAFAFDLLTTMRQIMFLVEIGS
eukprot:2423533-Pyramimonas_sp.AAC.1